MNDRLEDKFLVDHSYIWLVSKSMVQHMGFADMSDFINSNYYIKANLSQNRVLEKASGRIDLAQFPEIYTGFLYAFAKNILPGANTEQLIIDMDRNSLLVNFEGEEYFGHKEYSFGNEDNKVLQLEAYSQLYMDGEDIFVSILLVDVSTLYNKSIVKSGHSEFDMLSGVFNRAYGEHLGVEFIQYHPDSVAAVAVVNINNFTGLNSEYGHKTGNGAVVDVSYHLSEICDKNCIISRTSADEFTIFMKNESQVVVEDILSEILESELCITDKDKNIPYTVSVGYAMYPEDSRDYSELCRMAELALDYSRNHPDESSYRFNKNKNKVVIGNAGFNMMDIANGIPGALLVYKADGDEEILYANNETIRLFECDDFDDFIKLVKGSFKGFVYKDDLERVETSIRNQLNNSNKHNIDYVEYRIVTKNGVIREIDDIGRLVDSPYYGKIFYVFLHDISRKDSVIQSAFKQDLEKEEV